jgi:hypothetical protein
LQANLWRAGLLVRWAAGRHWLPRTPSCETRPIVSRASCDARGRLRQRALERVLLERVAGQQILEGDALRALLEQEERPSQPDAA